MRWEEGYSALLTQPRTTINQISKRNKPPWRHFQTLSLSLHMPNPVNSPQSSHSVKTPFVKRTSKKQPNSLHGSPSKPSNFHQFLFFPYILQFKNVPSPESRAIPGALTPSFPTSISGGRDQTIWTSIIEKYRTSWGFKPSSSLLVQYSLNPSQPMLWRKLELHAHVCVYVKCDAMQIETSRELSFSCVSSCLPCKLDRSPHDPCYGSLDAIQRPP